MWVEPELDPFDPLDPELELDPELDEPELAEPVLDEPVLPELDDGVVVEEFEDEPEPELVPVLPVVGVVAALATSAPPARRPDVSAPIASTLRKRICMRWLPFLSCVAPAPSDRHCTRCARHLWCSAEPPQRVGGVV